MIIGDLVELAIFECVACVVIDDGPNEASQVSTQNVCLDQKSLISLQVSVMKFTGFDGKGAIRHEVILNYHIDEMGFRLGTQLSTSLWATDNQCCCCPV
jgi:hypothetical protein